MTNGQRYYLREASNGLLLLRDDPGTLTSSSFDDEWRLQADSLVDLLGDDGDADGDVVVD